MAAATVGTPYSQTLAATGGVGSYTWSTPFVQGGNLPPAWLSIDPALGTLSGTPTANGTFTFTARATDSQSNVGQQQITLLVNFSGTVITTNLPAGMAIVNVSGTSNTPTVGGDGGGASSGTNQSLWYQPFNTAGQLLEYTMPPGTYTMRVIDPTDAAAIFPNLTNGQLSSMWTAWTYNSPWITDYLVFDSSATSNSGESQLFAGADGGPGTSNPWSSSGLRRCNQRLHACRRRVFSAVFQQHHFRESCRNAAENYHLPCYWRRPGNGDFRRAG